jgi:hypothetical protein
MLVFGIKGVNSANYVVQAIQRHGELKPTGAATTPRLDACLFLDPYKSRSYATYQTYA